MKPLHITIGLKPITKKNSQRIIRRGNRPMVIPSAQYKRYEHDAAQYMPEEPPMISEPVNVKTVFFMPTRRRVDLSNLLEAAHDVLVHYGVLKDDNCKVIVSVDGSRVRYDKDNPRTEIEITPAEEETW
jgi:Holliday junction resolvase RusA-like endonuclease